MNELKSQIEAAYDHRGHVTLKFTDGKTLEGYLFNREFENSRAKEQNYVDVIVKDSDERRRIPISSLAAVELTGKDHAAGNSFEDYLKKKQSK